MSLYPCQIWWSLLWFYFTWTLNSIYPVNHDLILETHFLLSAKRNVLSNSLATPFQAHLRLASSAWLLSVEVPPGLCPCHLFTICTLSTHDLIHFSHQLLHLSTNLKYLYAALSSPQLTMFVSSCPLSIFRCMTNKHLKLTTWKMERLNYSTPNQIFLQSFPRWQATSLYNQLAKPQIYDMHSVHQQILLIILINCI